MPEPFKNQFSIALIQGVAKHLHKQWANFYTIGFIATASCDLGSLELKQRSEQITIALSKYLR